MFCNATPLILICYIYVMKLKYLGRASRPAPESTFSCFFQPLLNVLHGTAHFNCAAIPNETFYVNML